MIQRGELTDRVWYLSYTQPMRCTISKEYWQLLVPLFMVQITSKLLNLMSAGKIFWLLMQKRKVVITKTIRER